MTKHLFSPFALGPLALPSRVVMAPMTRSRAGAGNVVAPITVEYYAQRVSAALLITEATQVAPEGQGYIATPGLHDDAQEAGWRRVTEAVHARGGRIFAQLWHVGRMSHPLFQPGGALPLAPSAIAPGVKVRTVDGPLDAPVPRVLAIDEIAAVVEQYAGAARRARAAGFDGVELHGANGYLIDQFLRDGANQRRDGYGGSVENRARFLLEVTAAVGAAVGPERVGVRLSPRGTNGGMSDSDPLATFSHAARALDGLGLAYLHVVEHVAGPSVQPGERITPHLRRLFRGPLVVNGGYDAALAEEALAAGADLVAFGVPFIANPDLPRRLAEGLPLAAADRNTFYSGGEKGYIDYPAYGRNAVT